ncbi:hypothetical protein Tco_1571181 [Tanacetum coccineum]
MDDLDDMLLEAAGRTARDDDPPPSSRRRRKGSYSDDGSDSRDDDRGYAKGVIHPRGAVYEADYQEGAYEVLYGFKTIKVHYALALFAFPRLQGLISALGLDQFSLISPLLKGHISKFQEEQYFVPAADANSSG